MALPGVPMGVYNANPLAALELIGGILSLRAHCLMMHQNTKHGEILTDVP